MFRFLAITTLAAGLLTGCEYQEACNSKAKGYEAAKDAVSSSLKAPATAVYPDWNDDGVQILTYGECKFSILGFVDSQNGYGALIRSKFRVKVEYQKTKSDWVSSGLLIM